MAVSSSDTIISISTPSGILMISNAAPVGLVALPAGFKVVSNIVASLESTAAVISSSAETALIIANASGITSNSLLTSSAASASVLLPFPDAPGYFIGSLEGALFTVGPASTQLSALPGPASHLAVPDSQHVFAAVGESVLCISLVTRGVLWSVKLAGPVTGLLASDSMAIATTANQTTSLTLSSGLIAWQLQGTLSCSKLPAMSLDCSLVCAQTSQAVDGQTAIISIETRTGTLQWSAAVTGDVQDLLVDHAGTAIALASDGRAVSVQALASGRTLWRTALTGTGGRLAVLGDELLGVLVYGAADFMIFGTNGTACAAP
eukprot:m.103232 g.103232  ORF g.103232 m.103232 type:complete len:320 (+) comp8847_c0_seq1:2937-3896(+)